jgi:hypothetical protein
MKQVIFGPSGLILLGVILSAIGALWASQQQVKFEHDLRVKSDEIAKLNREIVNSVIGGDSFCYLSIGSINPQNNVGILVAVSQGEHPIYDVNARIVDLQKFEKIKDNLTLQTINQSETHINIGNMIKGTASMIRQFPLGNTSKRDFNIFFSARNGLYTQLLRLRKVNDEWVSATKVEKNGEVIFEKIDDNFPRSKKGEIDW